MDEKDYDFVIVAVGHDDYRKGLIPKYKNLILTYKQGVLSMERNVSLVLYCLNSTNFILF